MWKYRQPRTKCQTSMPSGTGGGGNVPDKETVGGEPGASRSMMTGKSKRLLGGISKTKTMWGRWYETTMEEEKLQRNKDIAVQCIDFCEVTTSKSACSSAARRFRLSSRNLPTTSTPSGGNCWLPRKPIFACRNSMLPCFRSFEVHTYHSECWLSRRVKRHWGFLTKSNRSRVCLS